MTIKVGDKFRKTRGTCTVFTVIEINKDNYHPYTVSYETSEGIQKTGQTDKRWLERNCEHINKSKFSRQKEKLVL